MQISNWFLILLQNHCLQRPQSTSVTPTAASKQRRVCVTFQSDRHFGQIGKKGLNRKNNAIQIRERR